MAEAKKKGLQSLHAMTFAAENIDDIINVIRSSEKQQGCCEKIASGLSIPEHQAEAIVHMPLGRLTKMEQEKIMEYTAAIKEEMEQKGENAMQASQLVNVVAMELTPTTIQRPH